ncbi:MAG: AAA family ATPase [Acidimicrobiia bacterium]|nr:AAA family ATPase [Acidimicrobiia bacterium]
MSGGLSVAVLGPTELRRDDAIVALRPRERAVVAALALRHQRPATTDDVVGLLWPGGPPPTARKAVQNHVVRVRRAAGPGLVVSTPDGYGLGGSVVVDTERAVVTVRDADDAARQRDHERRRALLQGLLGGVRGVPFADLPDGPAVLAARRRFAEILAEAEDGLAEARLLLGDAAHAASRLTHLVEELPARERRWWLLMLAQYRMGRRRDALATYALARERLVREAGIEPGDELRRLERLVLQDDPVLLTGVLLAPPASRPDRSGSLLPGPFVGRGDELCSLEACLDRAVAGEPVLVLVEGEAGIGKTALARTFASRATGRGARVVWGSCEAAPMVPLQPFGQALEELAEAEPRRFTGWLPHDRTALAVLSPRLAEVVRAIGEPPRDPGRHRLVDAVVHVLAAAASERPLVLVLDDLHRAAPASQRLAVQCLLGGARLLVVATCRNRPAAVDPDRDAAPGGGVREIEMTGLSEEDVAHYVGELAGASDEAARAARRIHRWTGGNALFVCEMTRALLERAALEGPERPLRVGGPTDVPEAVRDVVLERLGGLASDTVAALQAASVLGVRFRPDDLQAMVGPPGRQLAEAQSAGFVRPARAPREMEFAHELLRQVVHDSLSEGERAELHDLAALAIDRGGADARLAEVAEHHLAAAPLDRDRAVESARRAATAALELYAYDEAADFYGRAFTLLRETGAGESRSACELAIAHGGALRRAGNPANAEVLVRAAQLAETLGDGDLLAEAALSLCQLGPTSEAGGSDERAATIAARALERASDPRLRAEVAGAASMVHSLEGEPKACRRLFEAAEREARVTGRPEVLARVLPYAYLALPTPEDLERRGALALEVIDIGRALPDLTTEWEGHHLLFSVLLQRADPSLEASLERLEEIAAVVKEPTRDWSMCYLRAAIGHLHGRLDASEEEISRSLGFAGAVSESRVLAVYTGQLLGIRADQDRLGELIPAVEQLVDDQPGVPAWHAAMALVAAASGDRRRVRREFDVISVGDFAPLPKDFIWTAAMFVLGRAVASVGDGDRSRRAYRCLAPLAGRMSWFGTGTYGPIDQVLGELARAMGDSSGAREHFDAATRIARRLDAPVFAARAEVRLGAR